MQPIGKFIVIEKVREAKEVEAGKLILQGKLNADVRYIKGRILATGTEVDPAITVGCEVLYDKHAGFTAEVDNKTLLIIKQMDIVTVL
jgi:co-chaperonin GroES (HSP10)